MKHSDNNSLSDEMRIASCKACLLAEKMKDCKNCAFRIGLGFKTMISNESAIAYTARESRLQILMQKVS